MQKKTYKTTGVCAREITFDYQDNKIYNVSFLGGCNGNLKAISKLIEGSDFDFVCKALENNTCGSRESSCADQLVKAIKEVM